MTRTAHGFSLVELLVVICVVAILAAMTIPAIQLAKEAALSTKCRSNLRQVGTAMLGYANDNDGQAPPVQVPGPNATEWLSLISPYAEAETYTTTAGWGTYSNRSVLRGCPKYTIINGPNRGFAMNNSLISGGNLNRGVPLASITYPSSRVLVSERGGDNALWGIFDFTRHNNRVNALMCDLHIQSLDSVEAGRAVNSPQSL